MKANFHLAGDLDVLVEPDETGKYVRMQVIRGGCPSVEKHDAVHFASESCTRGFATTAEGRHADGLLLQRNEARSLASAIMGCAAEL